MQFPEDPSTSLQSIGMPLRMEHGSQGNGAQTHGGVLQEGTSRNGLKAGHSNKCITHGRVMVSSRLRRALQIKVQAASSSKSSR